MKLLVSDETADRAGFSLSGPCLENMWGDWGPSLPYYPVY